MQASMQLNELVQAFAAEDDKFEAGNNAAGTRARKALMEIKKLADARRKEIQEKRTAKHPPSDPPARWRRFAPSPDRSWKYSATG